MAEVKIKEVFYDAEPVTKMQSSDQSMALYNKQCAGPLRVCGGYMFFPRTWLQQEAPDRVSKDVVVLGDSTIRFTREVFKAIVAQNMTVC